MSTILTLYELNNLLRDVIEETMPDQYWVKAEIANANEHREHLYLELVQKDKAANTPIARAQARCWANTWMPARANFERVTGQRLKAGMEVLLRVYAQYHEAYGFSWIVTDIDPTFTLGDMARRRNEIIRQLKEEGVFDMQKQLALPLFCQRIAVISSQTAAGYGDFCRQLYDNPKGYAFCTQLFPAVMQGEKVEESVVAALDSIYKRVSDFDCVVIIRGGGATSDLSGFDTLQLAENVANFPLPVITGIGHERDESVIDMVAHTRVKTPTAAAALLVDRLEAVGQRLDTWTAAIGMATRRRLETEALRLTAAEGKIPAMAAVIIERGGKKLEHTAKDISIAAAKCLMAHAQHIAKLEVRMPMAIQRFVERKAQQLALCRQRTEMLNPQRILNLGYSMTTFNGKIVKQAAALKPGQTITTTLADGQLTSVVTENRNKTT